MSGPWIDLLDPDADTLQRVAPDSIAATTLERVQAQPEHGDDPRPRIEAHGDYIFGIVVVPQPISDDADVVYQEVDILLTATQLITIRKTPVGGAAFEFGDLVENSQVHGKPPGMCLYRLYDEIAEKYLQIVDRFDDEIDELEDEIQSADAAHVRGRISQLRHDILHVRRVLTPMRDATRSILDNRVELDGDQEVLDRDAEIHFADAYDKFLRATDGLDLCRDLLAGVRDYHQAEVANSQNEVMKRLTVVAAVLLLPTFIVGLYGQNLKNIPEFNWKFGYAWSWGLIVVTTAIQIVYFRRKKWI